jgi:hypothetical protein
VKTIVGTLIAILLLLVALVVVVGPGTVVAGAESPFGIGPWSTTGHYCQHIFSMSQIVDQWKLAGQSRLTPSQEVIWRANETTLTNNGPQVPIADFTAFFRTTGNVARTMKDESLLINKWWDQNCADPLMQAPASISHAWSGIVSHAAFVRYPKNIVHVENFIKAVK